MNSEIKVNDKLSLRIPRLEDAEDIFQAIDADRKHLGEWLKWVDKTISVDDTIANINERIERFKNGEAASFIAYYEGKPVASVGFISLDKKNNQGEIGYWLASAFTGKGIMTESVKAVIAYGFKECNLHKIVIRCNSKNIKSAKVPQRLGFTLEATLRDDRFNGEIYNDTLAFGLLKGE